MNQSELSFSLENIVESSTRLKELREVIELHQNEAAREYGLATVSIILEDYDAALSHIKNVIAKKPDAPLLYRRLAEILILRDEHEEAIAHLEKAFDEDPKDSTTPILLLSTYHRTGNFEKAKKLEEYLSAYKGFLNVLE